MLRLLHISPLRDLISTSTGQVLDRISRHQREGFIGNFLRPEDKDREATVVASGEISSLRAHVLHIADFILDKASIFWLELELLGVPTARSLLGIPREITS